MNKTCYKKSKYMVFTALALAGNVLTLPAQSQQTQHFTPAVRALLDVPAVRNPFPLSLPLDPARHILHITADPVPNDPYMNFIDTGSNWAPTPYQWGIYYTQTNRAWGLWQPKNARPIVIAIVDTGVDDTHEDLTNMILRDVNGTVIGFNSLTGVVGPTVPDHPHGTHVAGIAAAQSNNNVGIAGVAGWTGNPNATDTTHIKIMPVKALDATGNGTEQNVADGIDWAVAHGANIINMSLGDVQPSALIAQSVANAWAAGCLIICAAGNEYNSDYFYPAASPYATSVAATTYDPALTLTPWSTRGSWVNIAAPGDTIVSTYPNNQYVYDSGTSMSSPHIAGLAALVWAQNPELSNAAVLQEILTTADKYAADNDPIAVNSGKMNSYNALQAVNAALGTLTGTVSLEGCANANQTLNFHFRSADGKLDFTDSAALTATSGTNSGTFTLANLPAATYNVSVKGAIWLQKTLPVTISSTAPASLTVLLNAGDANNDNVVDTLDFNVLIGAFGGDAALPGSGYDPTADFNCDGHVDTADFNLLAGNFGLTGDN